MGFGFSTGVEFALEILLIKGADDGLGFTAGGCFMVVSMVVSTEEQMLVATC